MQGPAGGRGAWERPGFWSVWAAPASPGRSWRGLLFSARRPGRQGLEVLDGLGRSLGRLVRTPKRDLAGRAQPQMSPTDRFLRTAMHRFTPQELQAYEVEMPGQYLAGKEARTPSLPQPPSFQFRDAAGRAMTQLVACRLATLLLCFCTLSIV